MTKWNWFWSGLEKRSKRNRPAKRRTTNGNKRNLQIEPLECRQLLSVAPPAYTGPVDPMITGWLVAATPDPHPTGDPLSSTAQMIPLSAYTLPPPCPNPFPQYATGLQQIYSNIENNPQARPSFWGETTAAGGDEYKLHLCNNGMLIETWSINWGDGSDPQMIVNQQGAGPFLNVPWVTHQYSGSPSQYAITVTAFAGIDGSFTGGTGDPGTLDQGFNPITLNTLASLHGAAHNPEWANQIGNVGQQTTNFEDNAGYDSAAGVALDNGNILVAGTTDSGEFGLARYVVDPGQSDDGNPDLTFGTNGQVATTFSLGPATANAVAVDAANGTIIVAGTVLDSYENNEVALACYNDTDGSLDTNFGTDGIVTTNLPAWYGTAAVAVQSDGSILVAGMYNWAFWPAAIL